MAATPLGPPRPDCVIVRRDRTELLPWLRELFGPRIPIVVDRRETAERRRITAPRARERRHRGERRVRLLFSEQVFWREAGYRTAYRRQR